MSYAQYAYWFQQTEIILNNWFSLNAQALLCISIYVHRGKLNIWCFTSEIILSNSYSRNLVGLIRRELLGQVESRYRLITGGNNFFSIPNLAQTKILKFINTEIFGLRHPKHPYNRNTIFKKNFFSCSNVTVINRNCRLLF